jgi:hypothetical protein
MAELVPIYGGDSRKISPDSIKSIIGNSHFTATEKRYIKQGLAEGFTVWKSPQKTFEVKKVDGNQITINVVDFHTDMIGRRVRQSQTGIVTLKD